MDYQIANDGEEPNWDDPIIYWDDTRSKASWFWGGDAEQDFNTQGTLRFTMSTMANDADQVACDVMYWCGARALEDTYHD